MERNAMSPDDVVPDAPATGETSWFCCGSAWGPCGSTGHGACGTCNSGSRQCAWPNTSDACFSITRPDRCGEDLLRRTCGHTFFVRNLCRTTEIAVTIADCGPQTDLWCGERSCCSGSCASNRILDLTPSAFSAIGNLSSGIIPMAVHS
jgi:hypothetical protein